MDLALLYLHCSNNQALSEERASSIEKLTLQLDLANEKVAVLTAEMTHLEQEGRQVRLHVLSVQSANACFGSLAGNAQPVCGLNCGACLVVS
jgi:hypothetical protein